MMTCSSPILLNHAIAPAGSAYVRASSADIGSDIRKDRRQVLIDYPHISDPYCCLTKLLQSHKKALRNRCICRKRGANTPHQQFNTASMHNSRT